MYKIGKTTRNRKDLNKISIISDRPLISVGSNQNNNKQLVAKNSETINSIVWCFIFFKSLAMKYILILKNNVIFIIYHKSDE
ncbi:MAG: hypothetical protein KAT32_00270 [Candidatus Moranbacteria bacterium]|nr:hypothetical protein [Candidatus Moranbacteria bacterium]